MSVYLSIDGGEPEQIASNTGWSDVLLWSQSLSPDAFYDLIHLFDHGWDDTPAKCVAQLEQAMSEFAPDDDTITSTLQGLLSLLKTVPPDAVVTINNGMTSE